MANQAYLSVWTREFSEATMLEQFGELLETVPFSAAQAGFTSLVIRAVDSTETPIEELDLRRAPQNSRGILELVVPHVHADIACEVEARWDLWVYDVESREWRVEPTKLGISCQGTEYDGGAVAELGHFQAGVGFEHLFTGHAGLLGGNGRAPQPEHPAEAAFLAAMEKPENLSSYHEKTRENIRKLMSWMEQVEKALPVERTRLWSEGEENFEARLDAILAVR